MNSVLTAVLEERQKDHWPLGRPGFEFAKPKNERSSIGWVAEEDVTGKRAEAGHRPMRAPTRPIYTLDVHHRSDLLSRFWRSFSL